MSSIPILTIEDLRTYFYSRGKQAFIRSVDNVYLQINRAMIAMALSSEPLLLIADEPTTGLDATIQSRIVDLLSELKSALGTTTMLICHDINVIRRLSDSFYGKLSLNISFVKSWNSVYTFIQIKRYPGQNQILSERSTSLL